MIPDQKPSQIQGQIEIEQADVHSASDAYAARFAGDYGRWILKRQEDSVLSMLSRYTHPTVLDVGGGHGQLATPLVEKGYSVTVLASATPGLLQVEKLRDSARCQLHTGDLLRLPYHDQQFDIVLCFRLLPHCEEWQRLIGELCRVARRAVIVDYPDMVSVNLIAPLLFKAKKRIEKNTRPFTLFTSRQIAETFQQHAFFRRSQAKQFFWPLALHRLLKNPRVSKLLEAPPHLCGLTRLLGSPVVLEMQRKD